MVEHSKSGFYNLILKNKVKVGIFLIILFGLILFLGFKTDRSTEGLNKYETAHFDIYYSELKQETLSGMENSLENAFNKSEEFFGYNNKTEVIVYPDNDKFQKGTYGLFISLFLGDWAVGAAADGKIFITSPENPDESHNYEDMLDILFHEYIHTRIWSMSEDASIWLDEGLASYFSGQKENLTADIPSFEEMDSNGLNNFVNAGGYKFSYYYVEYLIETYSNDEIIQLIKTNDYDNSLGKSKKEVYEDWVENLKRII